MISNWSLLDIGSSRYWSLSTDAKAFSLKDNYPSAFYLFEFMNSVLNHLNQKEY